MVPAGKNFLTLQPSPNPRLALFAALLLTCISGFVDAVGFLTFARIYTANMSGNSVALGIALNQRNWPMALFRLWPILLYVVGLVAGRTLIALGARRGIPRIASLAFACDAILLGFAIYSGNRQYLGVALLSLAMGIQTAALTKFSSLTLNSGFVTGTLVKFAEQLVAYGAWFWNRIATGHNFFETAVLSPREPAFHLSIFLAFTWMAYVAGAILGAFTRSTIGLRALFLAILALFLLTAIDLLRPLAIQEEISQTKLAEPS